MTEALHYATEKESDPYWVVSVLDVVRVNAAVIPLVLQSAFLTFGNTEKVPPLPPVAPVLWWCTLDGAGPLSSWSGGRFFWTALRSRSPGTHG